MLLNAAILLLQAAAKPAAAPMEVDDDDEVSFIAYGRSALPHRTLAHASCACILPN